jgi:hypothetical protein
MKGRTRPIQPPGRRRRVAPTSRGWGTHEIGAALFVKKNKADLFAALAPVLLLSAKKLLQQIQASCRAVQLSNPRAFPEAISHFPKPLTAVERLPKPTHYRSMFKRRLPVECWGDTWFPETGRAWRLAAHLGPAIAGCRELRHQSFGIPASDRIQTRLRSIGDSLGWGSCDCMIHLQVSFPSRWDEESAKRLRRSSSASYHLRRSR